MLGKETKGRVAVFIDAANLFYCMRALGWRIDFKKFALYLKSEMNVVRLSYYSAVLSSDPKQIDFMKKLGEFGFSVVMKDVKLITTTNTQVLKGSLDVELALDAALSFREYDTLMLFSGDSDFAPLLDKAKQVGKFVVVVSDKGRVSRELIARAPFVNLKKLRPFIERQW